MNIILIRENEEENRLELLDFLSEKGFLKKNDEVRTQDAIVKGKLPIVVDMGDKTYSMMGNVTCAAAAASSAEMITKEEFYRTFDR